MDEQRRDEWIETLSTVVERIDESSERLDRIQLPFDVPFTGESPPLFGNYAYVCTRCRARRTKLFEQDTYDRLMRMGLSEIARFMEESTYRDEIDRLGTRYRGVDLIEYALNENLAATYREVLGWCKGKPRYLLEAYLKRWDVWNLKTVLRSTFSGVERDEVIEELILAGSMTQDDIDPLLDQPDVLSVVDALEGTEWHAPLRTALEDSDQTEEVERLTEIENALDRHHYEQLAAKIPKRGRGDKRFAAFVREEIDIVNLRTILRLNRDGYGAEEIDPLILDGGDEIVGQVLDDLIAETDLEGTARRLRETEIGQRIADKLDDMVETGDVGEAISALERTHQRTAGQGKRRHPLSMLPIIDFLMAKKAEVDTIRIIARGKEHQLPDETIREQAVVA